MLTLEQLERYTDDIVTFAEECYFLPSTKQPIKLEEHQKRILRHVFRRDKEGRFPYDTVIYSCPKKSGKTEIAALVGLWLALTEEPYNEVYALANDFEQARGRVFRAMARACLTSPLLRSAARVGHREILFPSTGTTITALASEYAGAAGANPGLTLWDELWGYVSEASHRLWEEMTPVPTRHNSIRVIVTYAGWEGESELLWNLYLKGVGPEENPKGQGHRVKGLDDLPSWENGRLFVYWDHEPRMPWQTPEYYEEQRASLRTNAFLRMHGNMWVGTEEAFVEMAWWDKCVDPDHRPLLPTKKVSLTVGVDVGIKHDSAAVVAVYYDRVMGKVVLANHRIWQPSPKEPLDIEATIEAHLVWVSENYRLSKILYDPYQFHRSATTLKSEGLPMEEFPQTVSNLTQMGQNLYELIKGGNFLGYEDGELRRAISHTVAKETSRGWRLTKEKAAHKIDVVVALAMASLGAIQMPRPPGIYFL